MICTSMPPSALLQRSPTLGTMLVLAGSFASPHSHIAASLFPLWLSFARPARLKIASTYGLILMQISRSWSSALQAVP